MATHMATHLAVLQLVQLVRKSARIHDDVVNSGARGDVLTRVPGRKRKAQFACIAANARRISSRSVNHREAADAKSSW